MLHLLGKIPNKVILACSGGPDSMAVLDFLLKGGRKVPVAYFDHQTEHSGPALRFLEEYCFPNKENVYLYVGEPQSPYDARLSKEEYWRNERYAWLTTLAKRCGWKDKEDYKIITCHHLDDQVEQYLFSTLNGKERLIPY